MPMVPGGRHIKQWPSPPDSQTPWKDFQDSLEEKQREKERQAQKADAESVRSRASRSSSNAKLAESGAVPVVQEDFYPPIEPMVDKSKMVKTMVGGEEINSVQVHARAISRRPDGGFYKNYER
eukprot:TRINITY_DN32641_c0_g1_i1.p2 TRINITY_DN32641_c0_g1~~TRINITY_DN32641_c0_g1_i1.p2  ORF type:complete len:123 (+),score=24.08 TRINITY_DN32641_c0_g1_i1:65-433(+)